MIKKTIKFNHKRRNKVIMGIIWQKNGDFVTITSPINIVTGKVSLTFDKCTENKKDLRCTFVTLYGVKQNMHSEIVSNNIMLDDLFHS